MSEVHSADSGDDTPMIRRRFLTPKVRVGQRATGDQVLVYVEKVNCVALCFVGVCAALIAVVTGQREHVYGVLCGVVVAALVSLVSFFASRYQALGRFEGAVVQAGAYIAKFVLIIAAFVAMQTVMGTYVSVPAAALILACAILLRLVLSAFIIARTPVALDIVTNDSDNHTL